ncbi:MAG: hypothetical protein QOD40_496 [Alphaproteobacteria bacterium]|nr:hypothetical protein [Alphaproteobacteria bacterium]
MSYAIASWRSGGRARHTARSLLMLPFAIFFGVTVLAATYVAYVLWPRWPGPPVDANAASLPIVIAGVTFKVPPGSVRRAVQRRPGAQERVDLVFLWPSLTPPDATEAPSGAVAATAAAAKALDRMFVTLASGDSTLAPAERVNTIYPRYLANEPVPGPNGLVMLPFRNDTPYRGEDLLYPPQASGRFILRCTRQGAGPTPGTCLYERRIASADITVRFPRDWLDDWNAVANSIDQLIDGMRPQQG